MLTTQANYLRVRYRPANDKWPESWTARFLLDDDELMDASVNDQSIAEALAKVPRLTELHVQLSRREAKGVFGAYRFVLEQIVKS